MQKIIKTLYNRSGQVEFEQVKLACELLENSGVIALPTDTLYGIAAKVNDSKAIEKIYNIKGRDHCKPLAVCVPHVSDIKEVAEPGKVSEKLLSSLLPGPVTVILRRTPNLNKDFNPNLSTVGVRIPDQNFIRAVAEKVGPLALTSANKSGSKSSLSVEDFEDLWPELDGVFDIGLIKDLKVAVEEKMHRLGSTVIDLSEQDQKRYRIIREGCALGRSINVLARFGYFKNKEISHHNE